MNKKRNRFLYNEANNSFSTNHWNGENVSHDENKRYFPDTQ